VQQPGWRSGDGGQVGGGRGMMGGQAEARASELWRAGDGLRAHRSGAVTGMRVVAAQI
jgi:hypothetical protein